MASGMVDAVVKGWLLRNMDDRVPRARLRAVLKVRRFCGTAPSGPVTPLVVSHFFAAAGALYSTPSWLNKNASTSTACSIRSFRLLPIPCPLFALVRSRHAAPTSCRRAVIFRLCIGSTRGSLAPVRNSTAGYFVPSRTWWYGEYAYSASNCALSLTVPHSVTLDRKS